MPAGNHVIYAETILSSSYLWRLHWLTMVSETCPSIKKKSHFSKREEKKGWWDRSVITCSLIPCGLVARIRRSHRRGRGSIPRTGVCLAMHKENKKKHLFLLLMLNKSIYKIWTLHNIHQQSSYRSKTLSNLFSLHEQQPWFATHISHHPLWSSG